MAATFESASAVVRSTTGSVATSAPAGVVSDDLLLLHAYGSSAFDTPSGWTLVNSGNDWFGNIHSYVWQRKADGNPADTPTVNKSSGSGDVTAVILRIDGQDETSPIDASAILTPTSNVDPQTAPDATASNDGSLAVNFLGSYISETATSYTISNSFTQRSNHASGNDAGVSATKDVDTGAVGTTTYSLASGFIRAVSHTIIIAPGAGGGGTTYTLEANSGSFTLTGANVGLQASYSLDAGSGAFNLSGQDVNLQASYPVSIESGNFVLSGQDVNLQASYSLDAGSGAFNLSGQNAAIKWKPTVGVESGSFILTGQDAALAASFSMTINSGSFVMTGQDAALKVTSNILAQPGVFSLTGQDAAFKLAARIALESAAFVLVGNDVIFSLGGDLYSISIGSFSAEPSLKVTNVTIEKALSMGMTLEELIQLTDVTIGRN